ncbi:hypothetical protein ACI6QG_07750 [Roseococcus sp. DSY-14]|uniref:hypothetical protein n=1 Tax=Roseococcus sp. DSY-14 TaxID=3369650 RepID=UPI00387B12EF
MLAAALLLHPLLLLNPGFFSHDEWERLDHIRRAGWWDYARRYAEVHPGPDFGHPVRPIGFLQQGLWALLMERSPQAVHGLDLLMHGGVAAALMLALAQLGAPRGLALGTGLAFVASPLATAATGWVGASFDRWFTFFAILAAAAAWRIMAAGLDARRGAALLLCSAGAILSKEAAAALPLALMLAIAAQRALAPAPGGFSWRRAAAVLALGALPVAAYLLARLPAIEATLAGRTGAGYYAPGGRFLDRNLSGYWAFPFLPHLTDFPRQSRLGLPAFLAAGLLHAGLLALAGRWFGWRVVPLYLVAYFVFLLPVLSLPEPAAHYLYAAAAPLALLLAALGREAWRRRGAALAALGLAATLMLANQALIQWRIFRGGACQAVVLPALEAGLAAAAGAPSLTLRFAADAPDWVVRRAIFGRPAFDGSEGRPPVQLSLDGSAEAGSLVLEMGRDCRLR